MDCGRATIPTYSRWPVGLTSTSMKTSIFLLLATVHCSLLLAASFDCDKARTQVEKLICGSAELGKLDSELNAAYTVVLNDTPPSKRPLSWTPQNA
jgi:uncharacterized protein YecT (DUF1311 family)